PGEVVGAEGLTSRQCRGGGGAEVADHGAGVDAPDSLRRGDIDAGCDASFAVQGGDRRVEPDLAAATANRLCQVVPDADGAPRAEAETLEGALLGEVDQEGPGRQLVGVGGEDGGAEVAKDGVH